MREIIVENAKDKNFIDYDFFMCLTKHIKDMLKILHDELALHEFGVSKSILWRDIHRFYKERYEIQQQASKNLPNPHRFLTVKCSFNCFKLGIEILNVNKLIMK